MVSSSMPIKVITCLSSLLLQNLVLLETISIKTFVKAGMEMTEPEAQATQALFEACSSPRGVDSVEDVQAAISNGAKLTVVDDNSGQTPFMAAVLRGKINIVKYFLDNQMGNFDVYQGEKMGYIPVDGAAFQGRADIMKLLLEQTNMDATYTHEDGHTPFHRSCWGRESRHTEVTRFLLEYYDGKMDLVNLKSGNGLTCREMTENEETLRLLDEWSQRKTEL